MMTTHLQEEGWYTVRSNNYIYLSRLLGILLVDSAHIFSGLFLRGKNHEEYRWMGHRNPVRKANMKKSQQNHVDILRNIL